MATLSRRLTLPDAVLIGLGSMIGAGVFAVWAPASAAAGEWLLVSLGLAAVVAFCNATSSAQLAASYPSSGGTYLYGREVLGEWWGFLAGWGFVIGKIASCAAMALTIAAYLLPPGFGQRLFAAAVVAVVTGVNLRGITRTALATRLIVGVVLVVLAALIVGNLVAPGSPGEAAAAGPYGVLQGAGLLFFAFAGYARIATLGEEVVDPRRTIPRAILLALAITTAVYLLVALGVTRVLDPAGLASSRAPLADAAAISLPALAPLVAGTAALAATGALLALIAGVGRTMLAMARHHDLPSGLAAVHDRFQVPHRAELVAAVVVIVLVLLLDLRGAIGFSSFGVLLYYFVANLAAYRQSDGRLYPRSLQALGMALCALLVVTLPWPAVAAGVAMFLVGVGYRFIRLRGRVVSAPRR